MGNLTQPLFKMMTRHELEEKAAILLREFYTIDDDIEVQKKVVNGDNLPEPRTTAFLRCDEDDERILFQMQAEVLSEGQSRIVETVSRYVDGSKITYATKQRVEKIVRHVSADTQFEQEIVDMFTVMLRESMGEIDDTRLNDIEILVERRWRLIDRARVESNRLKKNKLHIGEALRIVEEKFPQSHRLLWLKYVEERNVYEVYEALNLNKDTYDTARTKAMEQFLSKCPALEELQTNRRSGKHKPGRKIQDVF